MVIFVLHIWTLQEQLMTQQMATMSKIDQKIDSVYDNL